jgi:hypothetical protein
MSERDDGKIALEEHFYLPSFEANGADGSALDGAGKAHNYDPHYFASVQKRLNDVKLQLEEMDRYGIERMVLSLTQPGIQGIPDRAIAVDTAKRMNDDLAAIVAAHPSRFTGFAAMALQDVRAAGDELERAVSQLGFKGVLINGYSNIGDANTAQFSTKRPYGIFGPASTRLVSRSTCILAARYPASAASTRVIRSWLIRHGVLVPKRPCIRFV